ncbi:MAG: hypothetical protein AAGE52_06435 [Myxococcota bacterium]
MIRVIRKISPALPETLLRRSGPLAHYAVGSALLWSQLARSGWTAYREHI